MNNQSITFTVDGDTVAEADRRTSELEQWLAARVEGIEFVRGKANPETQDAGNILVALLAAPAAVEFAKGPALELAKGLADWLRKRRGSVSIGHGDDKVTIENADTATVERIIRDVLKR
ncbi:effector-associated constant component EACC1 [Paraburkholderia xenovorans]|uniref:effector-associated constant component EACC1 n=1 Tax=Paraburkholderia xenovorans TaxID=36873 RepID=UPI0038B88E9D